MFIVEEDKKFYSIFHPKGLILKNRIWGQFQAAPGGFSLVTV